MQKTKNCAKTKGKQLYQNKRQTTVPKQTANNCTRNKRQTTIPKQKTKNCTKTKDKGAMPEKKEQTKRVKNKRHTTVPFT